MLRVQLFPYCYRDPQTGKWVRAPHPAELQQIIARYADWVLVGPHEIREVELEAPE